MTGAGDFFHALGGGVGNMVARLRWPVLVLALALAGFVGMGAAKLIFQNNYRVYFSPENPELRAFEAFQAVYAKSDNVAYVIAPKSGEVFANETLEAVAWLTDEAWQLPFSRRVDSVTNFQNSYAEGDDLIVEDLVPDPGAMSDAALAEKKRIALGEPLLNGALVSRDARATIVNATLVYPELDLNEVPDTVTAARALRDRFTEKYPGLDVHMVGTAMLNIAFVEAVAADFGTLIPAMIVIILIGTALSARSFSAMIAVLLIVVASSAVAMGWAGNVGIRLSGPSPSAVIVILTLSVADAIHIILTARGLMRQGMEKRAAIVQSMRVNFLAVTITSVTTIIGFLALNFSDSPPFRDFGNISAVGVLAAWGFSVTLLPALLLILPFRAAPAPNQEEAGGFFEAFGRVIVAHWRKLLALSTAAAVALIVQIPSLVLSDEWRVYFGENIEFRRDSDATVEFFGYHPIEYSVESGEAGGVTDPAYLRKIEAFADWLRADPRIAHVNAITDVMKRLSRNLNADEPSFYRIPDDRELAAQYLLLYELSLPYGLDLNDRINIDKSASRVTATLVGDATTKDTREFIRDVDMWFALNAPELKTTATGSQVMFTYIAQRNVESMVTGTLAAILLIGAVMVFALQSLRLGLLSIAPNALPILAGFGVWALVVGEVGFSVAAVASLSLGIVIDDTVHFMTKYVRGRRDKGLAGPEAVVFAFRQVGAAIFASTVILAAGFGILAFSSFQINEQLGLLTTTTIVLALLFDLFALPGLLLIASGEAGAKPKQN